MPNSPLFALSAMALAFGLAASPVAHAQGVTSIVPAAQSVTLDRDGKATMSFTVSGVGGEPCGVWINYGDGDSPDTRVISRQEGQFPRVFQHTFNRAGQFTVQAKGDRVKSTPGCAGNASTSVNIIAAGGGGRRRDAVAENCPAGWALVAGSFSRQTGAFTCEPNFPEERMDCGPGLRYFESAGSIGCRPRGPR